MRIPVLWCLGTRDERVPVPETVAILAIIQSSDGRDWAIRLYSGADHVLRVAGTNRPVGAWDDIAPWLDRVVGAE